MRSQVRGTDRTRPIAGAAAAGLVAAVLLAIAYAQPPAGSTTGETPAALSKPVRLRVSYGAVVPAYAPLWVADEAGIYHQHGLDVELLSVSGTQSVPATLAGEADVSFGSGYSVINSRLAGTDLLIFLGLTNIFPYELMVPPDIHTAADLRGKTLGVSRFGSSADTATRVALQYLGLDSERDVTLFQTGSEQDRVAALAAGAISGAVSSPPGPTILRRMGFKSLLDLGTLSEQEMNAAGFAREDWLRANEGTAQAFTGALIEAIHFAKGNREFTERLLQRHLKLDDPELLADSYNYFVVEHLDRVPEPPVRAGQRYLESLVGTDPRAAGAQGVELFDLRFVERAVGSGLVDGLYGTE
jgi:NitT/TauT family transport system substrate-binding protein